MKWLQLSDIHLSSKVIPGAETQLFRKQLLKYLADKVGPVDYIFLTGDFRYGGQPQMPDEAYNWILCIADAVQVNDVSGQICMVPGNHDLDRSKDRTSKTKKIMQNYKASYGVFDPKTLETLLEGFSYYDSLYQRVYHKSYIQESLEKNNPHNVKDCGDFYLVMLNTALLSSRDGERGYLLTGAGHVASLNPPDEKPVIVLGHHGLDLLESSEQKELKLIFKEWKVKTYLCGDAHELSEKCLGECFYQITSGCLFRDYDIVDVAFTVGELVGEEIKITAHEWRDNWTINPHFRDQGELVISQSSWSSRFGRFEPILQKHLENGVKKYESEDVQIHTPQILLLLLQYPGSTLKRILDEYKINKNTVPFGGYLCSCYNKVNMKQRDLGWHFHWGINWKDLLGLEMAEALRQQKGFPYITENLLSYAVLSSGRSGTVKELQKIFGAEFEEIKRKILEDGTEKNLVKLFEGGNSYG